MIARRRPKVLFVTYGAGHVAMVIPVVKHLIAEGLADPIVLALTLAGKACKDAGLPYIGSQDLLPDGDQRAEILRLGAELTAGSADHPDIDRNESVAYHGLSYFALVQQHGAIEAARLFAEKGRRAFLPISLFDRVIAELHPDVVVATNSPRSEQAALIAASAAGVPSCCILDLFGIRADWLVEPGFADRLCVLSESVRTKFVERGRSPDQVVATGNPAFDSLVDLRDRRIAAPKSNDFNVLWATNPEPKVHQFDGRPGNLELSDDIATELRRCAESHPDWNIAIRPHPSQHTFTADGPPNMNVIRGEELEDQLAWADVLVASVSTVAIQASLAGIPVVGVEGSILSSDWPLAEYGFAQPTAVAQLGATLDRVRLNATEPGAGFTKIGGATRRVAEVILDLAAADRPQPGT